MAVRVLVRRGTDAQWTEANPVLADGEVAYSTDSHTVRVGDGVSQWSALDAVIGEQGAPADTTQLDEAVQAVNEDRERVESAALDASQLLGQVRSFAGTNNQQVASMVSTDGPTRRAISDVVPLRTSLAGAPNDWFRRSRYGLFVHYTYGGPAYPQTSFRNGTVPTSVDMLADQFDAEQFAEDVAAFGAEYVIFTAWHYAMHALYPSAVLDAVLTNHSADTDALRPLITALKARGIRVVFYVHPIDGHDLQPAEQAATGWNDATNGYAVWGNFINNLLTELGERYGTDLDGLWVDMMQSATFTEKLTDATRLRASLKAGNPNRVIIANEGDADGASPIQFRSVPDHLTREYMGAPNAITDWVAGASHLAWIPLTTGAWWALDPQGGASIVKFSANDMFRFSVLQAGTTRYSGGMAWAISPYAGYGETSLWEDGVETTMKSIAGLLAPIARSIKDTIASASFVTPPTVTLNTLQRFVATRSSDGASEFIHVLKPPAGHSVTLPKPADGAIYGSARNLVTGRPATLSPATDGSLVLTKHASDSWSATDTVFELTRSTAPQDSRWIGAQDFNSRNGAAYDSASVGSRYAAWTLSPTVNNQVETTFGLPADWNTFDIDIYWTRGADGDGTVVFEWTRAYVLPGGSPTVDDKNGGTGIQTPPAMNVIERLPALTGLVSVPAAMNHFRFSRFASGDTGPSMKFLGIILRRTS